MSEQEQQQGQEEQYVDPLMEKVGALLQKEIERRGWTFSLNDNALDAMTVASQDGLLPILLWEANQHYAKLLGGAANAQVASQSLPLYFFSNTDALCQVAPGASDSPRASFTLFSHAVHFGMEEYVHRFENKLKAKEPIPLDDMYINFYNASVEGRFTVQSQPTHKQGRKVSGR